MKTEEAMMEAGQQNSRESHLERNQHGEPQEIPSLLTLMGKIKIPKLQK